MIELGDHDVVLGRPFLSYMAARVEGDDCWVPTRHGPIALPRWVSRAHAPVKLLRISMREMKEDMRKREAEGKGGEVYLLLPQRDLLKLKTPGPEDQGQKGSTPESPDPLEKISRPSGCPELEGLLREFKDVFPEDLPAETPPEREITMRIPIKPGCPPPHQAPYRVPPREDATIRQTLEYLEEHGLVTPSHSEYAAPVVLAPKPDGSWRFCVDYRRLNAISGDDKYPIPRIDDCLDRLGKARYFSKIDLRTGYWQMQVHPEDRHKTAFRTQHGQYEWTVVPMGLSGAPGIFQRLMNHYLRKYLGDFVLCYLDDILIYSDTLEEHLAHVRKVLTVLREKKLYAKGSKCEFLRPSVTFLGFTVGRGVVDKESSKVEEVRNWPVPKTVRDVRSFLGLAGFYRKFVHKFAEIARPLTDILKSTEFEEKFGRAYSKKAPVELDQKALTAFEGLKQALISAPCLVIFDPTKRTEIWADASREWGTVGAVLMQDHGRGLQPVAFLSKVMTKEQQGYPTHEQELLALMITLEEWRHYVLPYHSLSGRTTTGSGIFGPRAA